MRTIWNITHMHMAVCDEEASSTRIRLLWQTRSWYFQCQCCCFQLSAWAAAWIWTPALCWSLAQPWQGTERTSCKFIRTIKTFNWLGTVLKNIYMLLDSWTNLASINQQPPDTHRTSIQSTRHQVSHLVHQYIHFQGAAVCSICLRVKPELQIVKHACIVNVERHPSAYHVCLGNVWGSQSDWREDMHTQVEHVNTPHWKKRRLCSQSQSAGEATH